MLKKCLHTPDAPINLILVGALQEHHMLITFSFQKTMIAFPESHPQLGGLSFHTEVVYCLSLLHLNYIPVAVSLPPSSIAFASFQITPNTFELWHCQFGHPGQEATHNMCYDFDTKQVSTVK
jgi:hypothetical protein